MNNLNVSIRILMLFYYQVLLCILLVPTQGKSQIHQDKDIDILLPPLEWRNLGPDRGGRSIAVAGHKDRQNEYFFGATGGGLWKTSDGGNTWNPVTDGKIGSASVGAIAVAESNPDIIYLGMGESQLRQNVLQGDGVYKSTDGGKEWLHLGLKETHVISRIRVDPTDSERIYVAALGNPFGDNQERGVFKSTDGGKSWDKTLYRDERTGAVDLVIDPNDPKVLYATLWEVYGGEQWKELTSKPGLPDGTLGKITITVSGADSQRIYANIEAEEGGLYRSDDGGETWELINNHRDLWQRAFYFQRIVADPVDRETIYVLNFRLLKSTDGGQSFHRLPDTHADHHDLWIDPTNTMRMINGNDGGGVVSVNGGQTWTHMRYPTAQIYRLAVTNDFPYHVCGAQQDNTTVCVSSGASHLRNPRGSGTEWMYAVGGGESGYVAPHPVNADIFYAGQTNSLTRYDRKTGTKTDIQPFPRIVMGEPANNMPERWNWTYPIVISSANPNLLFAGSQHLWRSKDEGISWSKISPDLTKAQPETLEDSGGPVIKDQDGPEIYGTIYSIACAKQDEDVIWTGSDDGMVFLTSDGGETWNEVTPADLPQHSRIGLIRVSEHDDKTAYLCARRYEMDDRAPYIWKTHDFGQTWIKIIDGIPAGDFVYSICEDPKKSGLLFAGTEHGVYFSIDSGGVWESLSLNLPDCPVTGIEVKENDLVISTHGRSFWVLDDIETLRQINTQQIKAPVLLFKPADAYRRSVPAIIDYYLDEPANLIIDILDESGDKVCTLFEGFHHEKGINRLQWNLRYSGATVFPNLILEGGNPARGPWAPPGQYQVRIVAHGKDHVQYFNLLKDPRLTTVSERDLIEQFELAIQIRGSESAANESVILIRELREQVESRLLKVEDPELAKSANILLESMGRIEGELYQVRNQSPKDKIAFPIKLNDRLTGLRSHLELGDGAPTTSYYQVFDQLSDLLQIQLDTLDHLIRKDVPAFNDALKKYGLLPIDVSVKD
jgi:photosystem II stability/assembly factor-like uncharacterized protein